MPFPCNMKTNVKSISCVFLADCYNHRPIIKHGHYEVLRKDGHVIRAHCDVGYFMIGSGLRLCQMHEKRFTGEEPRCEGKQLAVIVQTRFWFHKIM